jgi:hypothetical protein
MGPPPATIPTPNLHPRGVGNTIVQVVLFPEGFIFGEREYTAS